MMHSLSPTATGELSGVQHLASADEGGVGKRKMSAASDSETPSVEARRSCFSRATVRGAVNLNVFARARGRARLAELARTRMVSGCGSRCGKPGDVFAAGFFAIVWERKNGRADFSGGCARGGDVFFVTCNMRFSCVRGARNRVLAFPVRIFAYVVFSCRAPQARIFARAGEREEGSQRTMENIRILWEPNSRADRWHRIPPGTRENTNLGAARNAIFTPVNRHALPLQTSRPHLGAHLARQRSRRIELVARICSSQGLQ
jgi:hypothetical protein